MQSLVLVCGLLLLIIPVHAHVSKDFEDCRQFFFGQLWPDWPPSRYHREICQTYKNKYYFATLYDIERHIPVYSAYIFEPGKDHPDSPWCIEPQLVRQSLDKNMMRADELLKNKKIKLSDIEKVQAVYQDYQTPYQTTYNRGHLNPKGHHTGSGSEATFTLTNVVPQNIELNNGEWGKYEETLKKMFLKTCHQAYVLVGAIPSTNPKMWIWRDNKKRVNIPDYLWSAYCCVDKNGSVIKSGAATAKNTENKVQQCSLKSLQQFFKKLNKNPKLFENCNTLANTEPTGDCSSVIQ